MVVCLREETVNLTTIAFLAIVAAAATATAQAETPTATKKTKDGKSITVKMTGKYADCVRDGQKMGYSRQAAEDYCNKRNLRK